MQGDGGLQGILDVGMFEQGLERKQNINQGEEWKGGLAFQGDNTMH